MIECATLYLDGLDCLHEDADAENDRRSKKLIPKSVRDHKRVPRDRLKTFAKVSSSHFVQIGIPTESYLVSMKTCQRTRLVKPLQWSIFPRVLWMIRHKHVEVVSHRRFSPPQTGIETLRKLRQFSPKQLMQPM